MFIHIRIFICENVCVKVLYAAVFNMLTSHSNSMLSLGDTYKPCVPSSINTKRMGCFKAYNFCINRMLLLACVRRLLLPVKMSKWNIIFL